MNGNLSYQDEPWEELIDGKAVAMSPRPVINHHFISANLFSIFSDYLRGRRCTPFADGVDLYLTEKDRFVPDGMIVCDPDKIKADGVHGAPDLAVEILSPSTSRRDRQYKKHVYEKCGVREYWIVSPAEKSVEQYLLTGGELELHDVYSVHPDWMLQKMTEEERKAVVTEFKCSLFDDLTISLEDVFYRVT